MELIGIISVSLQHVAVQQLNQHYIHCVAKEVLDIFKQMYCFFFTKFPFCFDEIYVWSLSVKVLYRQKNPIFGPNKIFCLFLSVEQVSLDHHRKENIRVVVVLRYNVITGHL